MRRGLAQGLEISQSINLEQFIVILRMFLIFLKLRGRAKVLTDILANVASKYTSMLYHVKSQVRFPYSYIVVRSGQSGQVSI